MTAFLIPSNLAFDNYDELVSALQDWMNRNDLTGAAQSMIALAEARMRRALEPLFLETSDTIDVTDGLGVLPTDLSTLTRVVYDNTTLPRLSVLHVSDYDTDTSATRPYAYTLEQGQIRLYPACDVTVTVLYQPKLLQLSDAAPTNDILSDHPDLYFFGAMMFAEGYVANDERAGLFKQLFDEALGEVVRFLSNQRYSGPLFPRIARQW